MSQQLQITGGAKVRDLQDVIIGTSGVLSSLAFNVANGVPKLDVNGKILVSQLPNSVMEYQGTWNAATNTPTLVNGTGNQGDVYLCNVAGTTNFGAGPITFAVGDSAIYSGTIWQRAGGATGTVTSVGLTSTGNDAITITGSPITTSGNINLGFAGTNLQYINGAGDLTTFPTLISSIGLTMPSAFSVANSPLTANGTIAVTGAGYPSQYIRGDGTLADFPTSGGGGSSVSYYLNGGTSQGTIGGVTYYEMSKTADTGTGVDFNKTGDGFIVAFLTDAGDPAQLNIPAGNWNYEIYASMSSNGGTPQLYAELYVYDGTTFTLISTSSNEILYDGVNLNLYTFAMAVPATTLALTDRLAIKLYATNSGGKTTTVHTQDSHLCQIITTFSTGITALNGLTAQVQYFATGTSGTDFAISSATATHTFNLPVASASNTGKLSSTDWSTFNGKVPYTGAIADVNLGTFSITGGIGTFTNGVLNGNGSNPANLYLKKGVSPFFTNSANYGLIAAVSSSFILISDVDGTNYKYASFNLGSLTNNTNRAYTLPDASGTISLLESTQTFSGVNTFSALTSFTFSSGTRMDYGPYLTKGSVPTVFSGTTTNIYSDATTNNIVIRDNSSIAKLEFNNSTQTFTFPSASGTIALTSNLSSYVPYSGATTDLNLGLFNLYANQLNTQALDINTIGGGSAPINFYMSSVQKASIGASSSTLTFSAKNTNGFQFQNPSNAIIFSISNTGVLGNGTYSYTLPSATGTLALTSDLTGYVPLAGNVNVTGPLGINTTGGAGTTGLTNFGTFITRSDSTQGFPRKLAISMASGTLVSIDASGNGANYITDMAFSTSTASGINATPAIYITGTNNRVGIKTGTPAYDLDVSGTLRNTTSAYFATTSGSVGIGTTTPGAKLQVDGTIFSSVRSATIDTDDGVSNNFQGYGGYWALRTDLSNNFNIDVYNNGTPKTSLTILQLGGNVGIGTSSPSEKLHLYDANYPVIRMSAGAATTDSYYLYANQSARFYITNVNTGNGAYLVYNSSSGWTGVSDARWKTNWSNLEDSLSLINKLNIGKYKMLNNDKEVIENARWDYGIKAQELLDIIPDAVDVPKDENDKYGVIHNIVFYNAIKAIQELSAQVQEQNQTIQNLQEQINILNNK